MVCRRAAAWSLALTLLMASSAWGGDQDGSDEQTEAPPPLELLEFLGQWETDDGEWIDPQELEDPALVNLLEAALAPETAPVETNDDSAGDEVNGASQDDGGSDDSN
ncbi:MAG: hypothetical protein Q7V56_17205 [Gammaproteobacteria bacterium]|nr:hypothetical protein [Gammaproteobacteria bacterium]